MIAIVNERSDLERFISCKYQVAGALGCWCDDFKTWLGLLQVLAQICEDKIWHQGNSCHNLMW